MNTEFVVSLFQTFIFQSKTNYLNPFIQCPMMKLVSKDCYFILQVKRSPSIYVLFMAIYMANICVWNGCKQGRRMSFPSYSRLDHGLTNCSVGVYHGIHEGSRVKRFFVHRVSMNMIILSMCASNSLKSLDFCPMQYRRQSFNLENLKADVPS